MAWDLGLKGWHVAGMVPRPKWRINGDPKRALSCAAACAREEVRLGLMLLRTCVSKSTVRP